MNKKNDKFLIIIIMMLIFLVFSWFIGVNIYDDTGTLVELEKSTGGIYNAFNLIYSSLLREIDAVMYLLVVGGAYGVLSKCNGYRKLVDKTAKLIKGKQAIAFAVITFLMGAYVSITYEILSLFVFIPFIVSVFLRSKCDRLTAISAAFGGLFIGFIGQTVGTYAFVDLYDATGVGYTDFLWQKIVIFILTYVLYNFFAIRHMNKVGKKDATNKDIYCPEILDEKGIPKAKKTKMWPTVVILSVTAIVMLLAHVSWLESFGISFFSEVHTKFQGLLVINDIPLLSTILGSGLASFGNWADLTYATFVIVIMTLLVALVNKVSISKITKYFAEGMKKISKVVLIYALATSLLYFYATYAWPATIVNSLFSSESFNVVTLLIGSFLNVIFCVDPGYSGAVYGPFLLYAFSADIVAATAIWRIGGALAMVIAPTSAILLCGLTYADIPYNKWLKYIWKFVLAITVVIMLFMLVVIYM